MRRNVVATLTIVAALAWSGSGPGCLSPERVDEIAGLKAMVQGAEKQLAEAEARQSQLLEQISKGQIDQAKVDQMKVQAANEREAARALKSQAKELLAVAEAKGREERLAKGVQIAEWAHGFISPWLGAAVPWSVPLLGILGAVISSLKARAAQKEQPANA